MPKQKEGFKCSKCNSKLVSTIRFREYKGTRDNKRSFGCLILGIQCFDCGFQEQREIGPEETV